MKNDKKVAVFTFGRFNPPTVGHLKLVEKVKEVARKEGGEPFVIPSRSQDAKKNPLNVTDKLKWMKLAFSKIIPEKNVTYDTSIVNV